MRVAVNVLDPLVTAVNRSALARVPAAQPATNAAVLLPTPWLAFLMMAVLLLLFEWWTYNRRLTV